jgi:hypothetical protein
MNYKKIFRDQKLRFRVLNRLSWVPDSLMLRLQYRIKMGFWPDFSNPKRFTEKIQVYKMKYRNPLMSICADKYEVRNYVEDKGLSHILNKLYYVCNDVNDINFDLLPNKFVIKNTTGGGGFNVILVKDKNTCDIEEIRNIIKKWSIHNPGSISSGREWAYSNMPKTRILIEQYLEDAVNGDALTDYKFFCFNGKPVYCQVITGRWDVECIDFFDDQWNHQNFVGLNPIYGPKLSNAKTCPIKPSNYEEMWRYAGQLAGDFPFVRVDLYSVSGITHFGELTFYPASGYGVFSKDDVDFELGSYFTEYGKL